MWVNEGTRISSGEPNRRAATVSLAHFGACSCPSRSNSFRRPSCSSMRATSYWLSCCMRCAPGWRASPRWMRRALNLVFEVAITDAEPLSQEDHLEFHWLPLDQLADTDVRPRCPHECSAVGRGGPDAVLVRLELTPSTREPDLRPAGATTHCPRLECRWPAGRARGTGIAGSS